MGQQQSQQQSYELEGQDEGNLVAKHLNNVYTIRDNREYQCLENAPNRPSQQIYKSFKPSTLEDLEINKINQGVELEVLIILPSFKMVSHMFVIMDKNNDINLTDKDVIYKLGLGNIIGIRNPFYKIASDRLPLIRIDNPNDVIVKESNHNLYLQRFQILVEMCQSHYEALKLLKQFSSQLQIKGFEQQIKQLNIKIQNTKLIPFQQQQKEKVPGEDYLKTYQKQIDKMELELDMNQAIEIKELMEKDPLYYFKMLTTINMLKTNQVASAISVYQDLIRQNDSYAFVIFILSELYFQQFDYQNTVLYAKKFLKIHEKKNFGKSKIYAFAFYQIGLCQLYLYQINESEKNLLKSIRTLSIRHNFILKQKITSNQRNIVQNQFNQDKTIEILSQKHPEVTYIYLNIIKLIECGQKLVELDDNNIFILLLELKLLLVDDEYTFQEKLQLINNLEQTEEFDIIAEDLYEILILHSSDIKTKTTVYKQYAITYQNQQEQNYSKVDVMDKVVLEIDKDDKNHQLLDERRSALLKPFKQQNQKYKQKKTKVKDIVEKKQELKDETSKYPGFIGKVENICQKKTYMILFDPKLNFDNLKLRLKFIQASLKWSKSNFNSSGIKYIKEAKLYEVKLCGKNGNNGKRLLCEQPQQDGSYTILNFDKLLSHQDAERRIAIRK